MRATCKLMHDAMAKFARFLQRQLYSRTYQLLFGITTLVSRVDHT